MSNSPETMHNTALLIIDTQRGIVELPIWRADETVGNIASLLAAARRAGLPVVYVQHDGEPGDEIALGSEGWVIDARIAPQADEPVFHKTSPDAFFESDLDAYLKGRGMDRLMIAGCMTQYCIDTNCRRAVSLGYDVLLAADGHGTADSPLLRAEQIIAHHNRVLDGFSAGRCAVSVRPTDALLSDPIFA
jgi:nicotinamidase-related amidase